MRCKDVQRILTDFSGASPDSGPKASMESHLRHCSKCARFRDDLEQIRVHLHNKPRPAAPDILVSRTRAACLTEISRGEISPRQSESKRRAESLPKPLWAAFFLITALTLIIILPQLIDFKLGQPLSFQAAFVLALLIQNGVMLFFAPVLIRRGKSQRRQLQI